MAIIKKIFGFLGLKSHIELTPAPRLPAYSPIEDQSPTKVALKPIRLPSKFDDMMDLGQTRHSHNRHWSVGFRDPGPEASREKQRMVRLRDNTIGKIVATVEYLQRPFSADVSDVGIFAVDDAGLASELSAGLVVFDKAGKQLYSRMYKANLAGFNISPCGRYLASQTCNSGNEDSFILEIHDIAQQRVLASRTPATGWSSEYAFETEGGELKRVFAKVQNLGKFAYSPTGEFLDEKKFANARLNKGDPSMRIRAAEELVLSDSSEMVLQRAMDVVESAIKASPQGSSWLASAYRFKGELLEKMGRTFDAIEAYHVALELNPKVGVKKRLIGLGKARSQQALLDTESSAVGLDKS
jgi:tetratricopeptide (TPR) repeat protein